MPFSESLKLTVRRRAAFRCCRCHAIGVEIHHILSQADDGPDTEDNAAPLCPNCHTWFGGNPEKRREIRQMRDWWYEVCETQYGPKANAYEEKLDALLGELRASQTGADERDRVLGEIQSTLSKLVSQSMPVREDSDALVTEKVNELVTATRLGDGVHANVHCKKCNSYIGLLVGSNQCPTCGTPL